jgi:phosphoglycolate phosphatase
MTAPLRPWDSYDGYLWDVDGTLLTCTDLVHYHAFNHALSSIAGRAMTIDGVVFQGNVDVGIMRDAFQLQGIPESVWRPHRASIIESMGSEVDRSCDAMQMEIHPAVVETLEHLRTRGAWLGIATGNLSTIGTIKLGRANLLHLFDYFGWSDDFETRADIFRSVARQARTALHPAASLCVVGDTPSDIRAAKLCGLDVVAVATGNHSLEQLQAEAPNYLVATLDDLPGNKHACDRVL